jgi:hypothetical protein
MLKLLSFYSMVTRLQQHCFACTAPLAQLISQTYFMPFALTANAIVARIFSVTSEILTSIERAWSLMTVALARAPPHSSPTPESTAVLLSALPALSAPLLCVHGAAVQQLCPKSPWENSFINLSAIDIPTDLDGEFHIDSLDPAAILSKNTVSSFTNDCGDCETCVLSQDDLGIPIGITKKGMISKALRRQKRLNESEHVSPPIPLSQVAVISKFRPSKLVAISKSSSEHLKFQESKSSPSAADDIYSALRL